MSRLDPETGQLGGEHQYARSRELQPGDPSRLAVPDGLLADGSVLTRAWREVDGYSLQVLQRWLPPAGPDAEASDDGTMHFHIDLPYDLGDDLGDNTAPVQIWLGATSNGFECAARGCR